MNIKRSERKMNGEKARKRVSIKERHIRWNYESTEEQRGGRRIARYFVIITNDRDLQRDFDDLTRRMSSTIDSLEIERTHRGINTGSGLQYLFNTFLSAGRPDLLNFRKVGLPVVKDSNLYQRKRGSVDVYVQNLLGPYTS